MKRLSYVLALAAVLGLAGTAAAGPALTIRGTATITLTGSTDDLTPVFGDPANNVPFFNLGFNSGFDITGDKWTLGGDLYASGSSFAVNNWKLTINPGIFQFRFAKGGNWTRSVLTGYSDYLGFMSIAGWPGNWDHMQLVVPVSGLTLVYDTDVSGSSRNEKVYVEMPKGATPFGFRALYDLQNKMVTGGIHYDFADNFWTEVGAVVKQGVENGAGFGAELNLPVTSNLTGYAVVKQYGSGYGAVNENSVPFRLVTLGQLTYTQPNYRLFLQVKPYYDGNGAVVDRIDYVSAGLVQKSDNSKTWYSDSNKTGYRNLKGWGLYAEYDIDHPNLLLAAGAPVIPDKAAIKFETPNALADKLAFSGQLYVKVSPSLTSTTDFGYSQASGIGDLTETLAYTVSGSSSASLTLKKPAGVNSVNYTAKFSVSY